MNKMAPALAPKTLVHQCEKLVNQKNQKEEEQKNIRRMRTEIDQSRSAASQRLNVEFKLRLRDLKKNLRVDPLLTIKNRILNFKRTLSTKKKISNSINQNKSRPSDALGDFKDFLEEFLITEEGKIANAKLLAKYLAHDESNLDILFSFITNPFIYQVIFSFIKKLSYKFIDFHKKYIKNSNGFNYSYPKHYEIFAIPKNTTNKKLQKLLSFAFETQDANPEAYLEGENLVKIFIYIGI